MKKLVPLVMAFAATGCATLGQLESSVAHPVAPRITVAGVALVSAPSKEMVARALCPRVAPAAICLLLGAPANIDFVFDVQLDIANDNSIPLPMVEALAAFTAFPGGASTQNLGAVCLSMCNDPASCPPRADACSAGGPSIRTLRDFASATAGFLVAVATGQAHLDNLRIKTIPAHGSSRVTIELQLDPQQIVTLLATLAQDAIAQIKSGQPPAFAIPYQIEGSVWLDVQSFGKLAAAFGPYRNEWAIR
jgi:hypothetical protein